MNIEELVITPFVCPLCGQKQSNDEIGVNSHLRKHVREGLLEQSEVMPLRVRILGRKFVDYRGGEKPK